MFAELAQSVILIRLFQVMLQQTKVKPCRSKGVVQVLGLRVGGSAWNFFALPCGLLP